MNKLRSSFFGLFSAFFFTFIFLGLTVRVFKLMDYLFYDWDEAIYAQVAREIIHHPFAGMTFNGHLWLEKPPLLQYILAGIFSVFGPYTLPARFFMVLLSIGLSVLLFLLTKKLINSNEKKHKGSFNTILVSLTSVLALASTPIFIDRATVINQDMFLAIGWVGYFLFINRFSLKLLFLTVGVLTKSLLGFYPLILEVVFSGKSILTRSRLQQLAIFIIIPSIWYILSYFAYGNYFIQTHFLDHLVKRLTDPIELHFGGRMYYVLLFWENFKFLTIPIIAGYLVAGYEVFKLFLKHKLAIYNTSGFFKYVILFSAVPFFVLLTFEKSKISWYLYPVIVLSTLVIGYLYTKLPKYAAYTLFLLILINFLIHFVPQTFGLKDHAPLTEKQAMAECVQKEPVEKVAYLVEEDERKIKNVLEAAHLSIGSSFIYGGSPSFVFYSQKKVDFYYDVDAFAKNILKYNMVIATKSDLENQKLASIKSYRVTCSTDHWLGLMK